LPRPLILYVTKPEDADEWVKTLKGEGFVRVEAFSGKTENDERRRIIREWNSNLRDIMVANSAFGIGVDKGDVRTVIHATLPENMDRFYQEVGRSGRDGCSSISLVCSANGDEGLAFGMTATARISTEKAVERWQRMQETANFEKLYGDILWVDPNVRPRYIFDADREFG
jgi:ATP-dependent DNA helicase RecQ